VPRLFDRLAADVVGDKRARCIWKSLSTIASFLADGRVIAAQVPA